jgi:hypothetical protein
MHCNAMSTVQLIVLITNVTASYYFIFITVFLFYLLENTLFSMEREMRIMTYVQVFFVLKRIISAVKRVEFVSDRMSYITLRGRWCHIIVLNVHSPTEDKTDDSLNNI